jgi:hypothetical protein
MTTRRYHHSRSSSASTVAVVLLVVVVVRLSLAAADLVLRVLARALTRVCIVFEGASITCATPFATRADR